MMFTLALVLSATALTVAVVAFLFARWAQQDAHRAIELMQKEKVRADSMEDRVARGVDLIARAHGHEGDERGHGRHYH